MRQGQVKTGSVALDSALDGGLASGATLLLEGPQGGGSTEFALTLLRSVGEKIVHRATFATALRTPQDARDEAVALFGGEHDACVIDYVPIRREHAIEDCKAIILRHEDGDALVIESTSALARSVATSELPGLVESVGRIARERGVLVLYLHSPGGLPAGVDPALAEIADGILTFGWRDGGMTRRRCLFVTKLRGLAEGMDNDQVPVFETALSRGPGFSLSHVRSIA